MNRGNNDVEQCFKFPNKASKLTLRSRMAVRCTSNSVKRLENTITYKPNEYIHVNNIEFSYRNT